MWEEVVYALVSERIGGEEERVGEKVNGVVLSVRKDEDILSLWVAPSSRAERDTIRYIPLRVQVLRGQQLMPSLRLQRCPPPRPFAAPHFGIRLFPPARLQAASRHRWRIDLDAFALAGPVR